MKVSLGELVYDNWIWPREKKSNATIEAYAMALVAGAKFPPIEIQRVSGYPDTEENETLLIIDGVQRSQAHIQQGLETIEYTEWQPGKVLDYETSKIALGVRAFTLNARHGRNTVESDRKALARRIAEADPNETWSGVKLAKLFRVAENTATEWIKDIRARQHASRDAVIWRLARLGWIHKEIATIDGRSQAQISKIIHILKSEEMNNIREMWPRENVETIAEYHYLDIPLVYSILLESLTDPELGEAVSEKGKFSDIGFRIYPYDYWPISGCMDIAGRNHPGRIPGQLVANTLYFFTERGEMIIDPMAGGGTVPDIALIMGRKCYAYDIDLCHNRPDILCHNMLEDGWPPRTKKANLIFWDPPYFKKKDENYVKGSISALSRDDYLKFFQERLGEAHSLVKRGTRLTFLMADWDDPEGGPGIYIWDYTRIIQEAGWTLTKHIQVPLSTQQLHADFVLKFRETKKLGRLERYLLIARR